MKNGQKALDKLAYFGRSRYLIVIGENSSAAQRYAAEELKTFLKQITDVDLPIVTDKGLVWDEDKAYLSVGETHLLAQAGVTCDYRALNGDGFMIRTAGKSLFINGYNDRGVIYGVYDFLETATGLRFVAYDCTYIPKINDLPLFETDRIEVPAFEYRGYFANAVFQEHGDEALAVRMRMNYAYAYIDEAHGGKIGWYKAEGMEPTHNILFWVPPGDRNEPGALVNTHPEFFVFGRDGVTPIEICWTLGINDDGTIDNSVPLSPIKIAVENMKKAVMDSPKNIDVFMCGIMDGPLDGSDVTCRCPRCRAAAEKYKWSGIMIRFVNLLADEIKKFVQSNRIDKDVKLVTLAYGRTRTAPVSNDKLIDPSVKPRENVYILIAPYFGDLYMTYDDPRQDPELRSLFADWAIAHDKFFLWGYTVANNSTYNNGLFYFCNHRIWRDLFISMKKIGVTYMTLQGQYVDRHIFESNFDLYVASKMMWNPERDITQIREEYIRLYYGPAAPFVSRVINRFDAHYAMEVDYNGLNYRNDRQDVRLQAKYHPYEFLKSQVELLDIAIATVKLVPGITGLNDRERDAIIRRVKEIKVQAQYLILLFYDDFFPGKPLEKLAFAKSLFAECEEIGLKETAEYTGLKSTKALFGVE